jgi:hypothetical protein
VPVVVHDTRARQRSPSIADLDERAARTRTLRGIRVGAKAAMFVILLLFSVMAQLSFLAPYKHLVFPDTSGGSLAPWSSCF